MSASGGYDYSYEDLERMARRGHRARLAELRARADLLADQARRTAGRRSGVTVAWDEPAGDVSSTVLESVVRQAEEAVEEAARRVDALVTGALLGKLGAPAATGTGKAAATAAPAEPASYRAPELDRARAAARERVGKTLRTDGPRCDPDDLEALADELARLDAAPGVEQVRIQEARIRQRVARSIKERADREEAALVRAKLRTLVAHAPAGRRAALLAAIESERDLRALTALVSEAVAEADRAAAPALVAAAAADALTAIGCEVGADFTTVLASDGESVVALDGARWAADRYALLVQMDPESRRLYTAVVRRRDEPADADADVAAQRRYCDDDIPGLLRREMAAGGVHLDEALRLEPGRRPMPTVEAGRWPVQPAKPKPKPKPKGRAKPRAAQPPAAKERRRER
ncbi:MAG TPA: hypothetical protein VFV01_26825 [Spirillospora sp.]|nr:hypothetical protein [Spirillospora sp.]